MKKKISEKKTLRQRKAFDFLLDRFTKHEPFTKEEFQIATDWLKEKTFDTHWSKHYETLVVPIEGTNTFRLSEAFRRFVTWESFRKYVTQKRLVVADYTTDTFDTVLLFEFFMPLTNEGYLRTALDALFYKDSIMARLKSAGVDKVKEHFKVEGTKKEEAYLEEVCDWISKKFVGYSISHVNGRYRASELKTVKEAAEAASTVAGRYLVDETTAIVRFIFPCGQPKRNQFHSSGDYFEFLAQEPGKETSDEATRIRWFFYILFVQSILEIVNGEDEIWLLESGFKNKLHIWKVQRPENAETEAEETENELNLD